MRYALCLILLTLTACSGGRAWLSTAPEAEVRAYLAGMNQQQLCSYSRQLTHWPSTQFIGKQRVMAELERRELEPLFCTQEFQTCHLIGYKPGTQEFRECMKESVHNSRIERQMARQNELIAQQVYEQRQQREEWERCRYSPEKCYHPD